MGGTLGPCLRFSGRKECRGTLFPAQFEYNGATKSVAVHSFLPTIFMQQRVWGYTPRCLLNSGRKECTPVHSYISSIYYRKITLSLTMPPPPSPWLSVRPHHPLHCSMHSIHVHHLIKSLASILQLIQVAGSQY